MDTTKKTWKARLPATPCDIDMREAMVRRAALEGKALADLHREAFALFLHQNAAVRGIKSN